MGDVFGNACDVLRGWMVPIAIASKRVGRKPSVGLGAGVVLNRDGWVLTAGHIVSEIDALYQARASLGKGKSKKQGDVEGVKVVWGVPGDLNASAGIVQPETDLGLCKLEGFSDSSFRPPKLRGNGVRQGELLCRAGYPLIGNIKVDWNSQTEEFTLTDLFPATVFVNEGVVARFLGSGPTGTEHVFIETSSPGLRGQSGGPLVDPDGRLCGIQIRTTHYPLGFTPQVGNRKEHQFLNAGQAVHVDTVKAFLDDHDVDYRRDRSIFGWWKHG